MLPKNASLNGALHRSMFTVKTNLPKRCQLVHYQLADFEPVRKSSEYGISGNLCPGSSPCLTLLWTSDLESVWGWHPGEIFVFQKTRQRLIVHSRGAMVWSLVVLKIHPGSERVKFTLNGCPNLRMLFLPIHTSLKLPLETLGLPDLWYDLTRRGCALAAPCRRFALWCQERLLPNTWVQVQKMVVVVF